MSILYWIWCFPQMFAALILRMFVKVSTKEKYKNATIYKCKFPPSWGSVSLGNRIFLCEAHWDNLYVKRHEYGHCVQSLIVGPLYLLVVGVPSFLWCNVFYELANKKKRVSYYDFYCEKWANRLGGN